MNDYLAFSRIIWKTDNNKNYLLCYFSKIRWKNYSKLITVTLCDNRNVNEIVLHVFIIITKEYRNTCEKIYRNGYRAFLCDAAWIRNEAAMQKRWIGIGSRSPRSDIRRSIQRRLVISSRIINRRDIDASRFSWSESACLNAATVNVRLGGIPESVRYSVQGRCGWSIWVNRQHQDYPDPANIASIRLLRTSPRLQPRCKLQCSPARCIWHASSGIGMRVHNDPIALQHSGDYLTMTRDKVPYIKVNERDRDCRR